jgi:hypothetical protein
MQENVQEWKGYRSRNENAENFLRQMQASAKLHVCINGSIYASCFCLARLSSFGGRLKNLGNPFDGLATQGAYRVVVLSQTERIYIVTFQSSIEDIKTKRGCAEVGCDVIRRLLLVGRLSSFTRKLIRHDVSCRRSYTRGKAGHAKK